MKRRPRSAVTNLQTTGAAIADHFVGIGRFNSFKKFRTDLHGNFVSVLAKAVVAGNAATIRVGENDFSSGNLAKNISRRSAETLRLQVAGHVIHNLLGNLAEMFIEPFAEQF